MSGPEVESRQSFPTYAELAQTAAWGQGQAAVQVDPHDRTGSFALAHHERYTEGALLGTGGMGRVLLARDARIGRDVAVKVLHSERERDADARARFLREGQVQGQLEHPSIVPVYDIDRREDGTTFFTMRRVQGHTLAAIIEDLRSAKGRYTRRELLTAFATVCLTVDYAHSRGVVHRDLKPANIMLGDFGEVYVLDWGLARLLDEPDESMPLMGTPLYMAPEQMQTPNVGASADVYTLGLILYEILTYRYARDPLALFEPVDARPSVHAPERDVPLELEMICVKATAVEEAERYPSARALHDALARFLDGDRALEQRRQLAAKHVESAHAALLEADDERQRGTAMTELTRAVALDPHNEENVAMLADILAHPPPTPPDDVERAYRKEQHRVMRRGAVQGMISAATWVLALPILLLIGLENTWQLAVVSTPMVLAIIVHVVVLRHHEIHIWTQYATITLVMVASAMVSLLYGPLVLAPVMVMANAIAIQAHPFPHMQRFAVITAIVAIVGAVLLEYAGVVPRSYQFTDGHWTIEPQLVRLPYEGTLAFITAAVVSSMLIACNFIAGLRNNLTDEQLRRATQAWHFRQLGARLVERG